MRILVVDDDPAILKMCSMALKGQGHEIVACEQGQRALTQALMTKFDVALCDINLPDVHGLEIVRAIKMQSPELPVIVMSALDVGEWRPKAVDAGADHFLSKPLRLDDLRNEVEMALGARSDLRVVLVDKDEEHRLRVAQELRKGGCSVRIVERASMVLELADTPELVIVDASDADAKRVVRWAGQHGVACFVLFDPGASADVVRDEDALLRAGASLIVQKPVETEALLIQARFLATNN